LDAYYAGKRPNITSLPLAPAGSVFRQTVWDILCSIPYGQTMTYGQIAATFTDLTGKTTTFGIRLSGENSAEIQIDTSNKKTARRRFFIEEACSFDDPFASTGLALS
jgi:O6-methylguanine-DNA--protein-cysteine methyltransferase